MSHAADRAGRVSHPVSHWRSLTSGACHQVARSGRVVAYAAAAREAYTLTVSRAHPVVARVSGRLRSGCAVIGRRVRTGGACGLGLLTGSARTLARKCSGFGPADAQL